MHGGRIKILLVEDDKIDQMAFERFVKDKALPYDYVIAGSVSKGKTALRSDEFDVVVMDYLLGDGTAFDLFEHVNPDIPIVVVTGTGDEEIAVKAIKSGALDYIIKDPFRNYLKTMPVTVESVIKARRTERELKRYHDQLKKMVEERTSQLKEANEQLKVEIQQRKQAEQVLQESEEKFRVLFRSINDAVFVHPLRKKGFAKFIEVNDIACKRYGYTREEFLVLTAMDITTKIDVQEHGRLEFRKKLLDKGFLIFETIHIDKSGNEFPVEISSNIIDLKEDKVILAVVRDVTQRKQAEETLRKYEHIISATSDNMSFLDRNYIYLAVNDAYLKLHQKTRIEIVGHSVADLLGADVFEQLVKEKLDRCFAGEEIHYQAWFDFSGSGRRYMDVAYYPYAKADGAISGVVVSSRDITEHKQVEELLKKAHDGLERRVEKRTAELLAVQDQLIRSERLAATGQLAASIAHEINSPLQAVAVILGMLKDEYRGDEKLTEDLDILTGAFRNIRDTVKNLLDLNRPGKEEKQKANVNSIIEKTIELVGSRLKKSKVKVNQALSTRVPDILVSPQQLSHVFLNLINNAIEAMTGESKPRDSLASGTLYGGEINIKTNLKKGNVVIKVSDTGPGISDKDLNHIFDPFYTRKKKMGMGVGLSICHGFIEDHGGTIVAGNVPEGGAVFTITLPL